MSKAKWFALRKPKIIATSANQIVPPKFYGPTKMLYYIRPPFAVLKGDLGTRLGFTLFTNSEDGNHMINT